MCPCCTLSNYHVQDTANKEMVQHDGARHTYQIVGSWTGFKETEEMQAASDSIFVYDIVVGENGWEEFSLLQDTMWRVCVCVCYCVSVCVPSM